MIWSSIFTVLVIVQRAVTIQLPILGEDYYTSKGRKFCSPGQSCWPTIKQWKTFNITIHGKLIQVKPFASPCYDQPDAFNTEQCAAVQAEYRSSVFRANTFGAAELINWEACGEDLCWLNTTSPSTRIPPDAKCKLGRIAPYAVALATDSAPHDIAQTLAFAERHNIKLTIKNTGHDWLGRSTGKDSLAIWTHNLNDITILESSDFDTPVAVLGAGVLARNVYQKVTAAGYAITLGAYGTVGVAGGFTQGGGHGPLSPSYGLAVDNVVAIKVVTADGRLLICNLKTNSDLFFALRGGGGGSWGVVTEVTYKLHPLTKIQALALKLIPVGNITKVWIDGIATIAKHQSYYLDQGWVMYSHWAKDNIILTYAIPSNDSITAKAQIQPILDHFLNNAQYQVLDNKFITLDSIYDYTVKVLGGGGDDKTFSGLGQTLSSRLVPRSLFGTTTASNINLAETIIRGQQALEAVYSVEASHGYFEIFGTVPPRDISGLNTGVNPAWRGANWHVLYGTHWSLDTSADDKNKAALAAHVAVNPLRALTPGGGCYYNEADVLEKDWKTAFFGTNYDKLLRIKRKYDPTNVFSVWKGVGSVEGDSVFTCYANA